MTKAKATAAVPTAHGSRYLQQLCKHWSHKFETEFSADAGRINLGGTALHLTAAPDALTMTLTTGEAAALDAWRPSSPTTSSASPSASSWRSSGCAPDLPRPPAGEGRLAPVGARRGEGGSPSEARSPSERGRSTTLSPGRRRSAVSRPLPPAGEGAPGMTR